MPPDATMAFDVPKLIRYLLENMDFPKQCLVDEQTVAIKEKMAQVATVAAGAQQLQTGQASAETAPAVGRAAGALAPDIMQGLQQAQPQRGGAPPIGAA